MFCFNSNKKQIADLHAKCEALRQRVVELSKDNTRIWNKMLDLQNHKPTLKVVKPAPKKK